MQELIVATLLLAAAGSQQSISPGARAETASAVVAPTAVVKMLTRAEFDALAAKPEQLLVLDVRRPDELTSVGGFPVYLSIQIDALERSLAWIPKDRVIVTVSNKSNRSAKASAILAAHGFRVAGAIGVHDYESQGGTLTRIAVPTRDTR